MPGRLPHERYLHVVGARDPRRDRRHGKVSQVRSQRAGGRGHRHQHPDPVVVDLDAVDESEIDDVDAQLRIDDAAQRIADVLLGHDHVMDSLVGVNELTFGSGRTEVRPYTGGRYGTFLRAAISRPIASRSALFSTRPAAGNSSVSSTRM